MDHSFVMTFEDLEFVLSKDDVDFSNGLGLVRATLSGILDGEVVNEPLIGVVDKDFNPVIELAPQAVIYKLSIIDELNVLISTYDFELYHVKVLDDRDIVTYLVPGFDYTYMGYGILKLKNGGMEALYSLDAEAVVSGYYHHIGAFNYQEKYGKALAEASLFLPIDTDNYEQIITYLSKDGRVEAPYYAVRENVYFDASMDINEVLSMVIKQDPRHR